MFEKIGQLAETAATNVSLSRRGFLGQLGRGALVIAGAMGGLLSVIAPVQARGGRQTCCGGSHCSPPHGGCVWTGEFCNGGGYPVAGSCFWDCPGGHKVTSKCG
jgi:hypothetical protein